MLKRSIASLLILLFVFGICSCKKSEPQNTIVVPEAQKPTNTSTPTNNIKTSGTLYMPIPENANRKNPYSVTTEEMYTMYSLVFESLLSVDNTGKLVPSLAMSWSRSENSPTEWIISLRKGVLWHDGNEMTAEDVLFSFDTLHSYLQGEKASSYYLNSISKIQSISAPDSHTIIVNMKEEGISSLYALTFPIICKGTRETRPTNGTGPYEVSKSDSTSITLTINKRWWKELPHIENIVFLERLNNDTALASYEAGQINFVPTSSLSSGKYRKEGETNVIDVMTQNVELLIFNYKNVILCNANVRKALAYVINQSKIITNVYMNKAQDCDVPIAPDSWLYLAKSKVIETNIAYANDILDTAGLTDTNNDGIREMMGSSSKLSFTLLVSESTDNTLRKQAADMIAEQAKECGIEIKVVSETYNGISDTDSNYLTKLKNGEFDLALTGVNMGPDYDLTQFFADNGSLNFGNVTNLELLNLSKMIKSAQNETDMRSAAHEFQTKFVEQLPFLVLYYRLNSIVYSNDIKGLSTIREPNIMANSYSWYIE